MNLQAKVALLDAAHVNTIGIQLQVNKPSQWPPLDQWHLRSWVVDMQGLLSLLERVETQAKSKGEEDPERQTKASPGSWESQWYTVASFQGHFPPLAALSRE